MAGGTAMVAQPGIGAVGTPLPQTAQDNTSGGPFIRYARESQRPGYSRSGDAFGSTITNPLSAAPGYLRSLRITITASGGTTTTAAAQADGPYNVISFIQLRDPWGTPIVQVPGYELAQVINAYSGQCGLLTGARPQDKPSFSAVAASTGAFQFSVYLPLEAVKGYGLMSIGNSSVMPTLFIQYSQAATVLSGTLTTPPTLAIQVDEEYYDIDPTMAVEPPGNGSTLQWSIGQANQSIGSASSVRAQLPHTGGYLTMLGLVLRDSTGARIDGFNTTGRLRLYIDGVPQYDRTWTEWVDSVFEQAGGAFARPTGVLPIVFKSSLSQLNLGLLDSLEVVQQTTPGTQLEVEMNPWGTISNAPAQLNVVMGQIVPAGRLQQGLFEA